MNRRTPAVLVPVALAAALAAGCSARAEKATLPPAGDVARAVRTVRPTEQIETGLARATGVVRAREDAVLSARATGQIVRVRVSVGDRVKAGATLAELDGTNARIALQNARAMERLAAARLAEAERGSARAEVLREGGGLAESAFEQAQTGREMAAAQLDQARAAVRAAEQQIADTVVTAPFAGVVTAKFRNAGDTVSLMPISPIVALTDVDRLELRLTVPEALEPAVEEGRVIEAVTTPGGRTVRAKVRVKSAIVDPASRTVEVLADVVGAPGLRPGTLVTADFGRFGEEGGVFLPATAVKTDGKASWVFVVEGGKAARRDVVAAPVHPGTVAVRQGLDADAEVVLEPGTLSAGDTVVSLAGR
jgi:RND family efflux transporter MFP subunit